MKGDILSFFKNRRQEKQEKQENTVGKELLKLFTTEKIEKAIAVYTDSYCAEKHSSLPKNVDVAVTFDVKGNLDTIADLLVEMAKRKYRQQLEESDNYGLKHDNPTANVMLYDNSTKKVIGGIIVFPEQQDTVACVVNERLLQEKKRIFKNEVM